MAAMELKVIVLLVAGLMSGVAGHTVTSDEPLIATPDDDTSRSRIELIDDTEMLLDEGLPTGEDIVKTASWEPCEDDEDDVDEEDEEVDEAEEEDEEEVDEEDGFLEELFGDDEDEEEDDVDEEDEEEDDEEGLLDRLLNDDDDDDDEDDDDEDDEEEDDEDDDDEDPIKK